MPEYILRLRQLVGGDELLQAPSVAVALRDEAGRVLLARHVDGGRWVLPGGTVEPEESPADAAVREMWEESDVTVQTDRAAVPYLAHALSFPTRPPTTPHPQDAALPDTSDGGAAVRSRAEDQTSEPYGPIHRRTSLLPPR